MPNAHYGNVKQGSHSDGRDVGCPRGPSPSREADLANISWSEGSYPPVPSSLQVSARWTSRTAPAIAPSCLPHWPP